MNSFINIITNPAIISLGVGFFAGIYTSIEIPKGLSSFISLYLIFCIGFKGGLCLGVSNNCAPPVLFLTALGVCIGFIQPFVYYYFLKNVPKLNRSTKVVIATQYGSTSIVTFLTALTFLQQGNIPYNAFMSATAGIMELPAIFSGLLLLRGLSASASRLLKDLKHIVRDIVFSPKINFIFIGFFVGYLLRNYQADSFTTTILLPFTIILILFMFESGIKIAQQRHYVHEFSWSLCLFGTIVPMVSGLISLLLCFFLKITPGTALLFTVLIGSASYIAVPAIMRAQAPQAKSVIYLPLALGVTLPFNLIIGIPFFYFIAQALL